MHLNLKRANPVARHDAGFTLIELMVSITLFAILALLAMPVYSTFIANTQIRTATESILSGVRLAQAQAVKHNGQVEFVLDETKGWQVNLLEDASELQKSAWTDGASRSKVVPAGASRRVTFNGLGRIVAKNPFDDSVPLGQVDVTTSMSISQPRDLRVVIGSAYGIKACDIALPASDPGGCP